MLENTARTAREIRPVDLGYEAFGVEVTSMHGTGPSIVGAGTLHYEAPGYFPKIKERPERSVAIFAVLPRTGARMDELDRSYEPGFSGHRNPYVVGVEARVCEFDYVYYEGSYPDDAICLVVVVRYEDFDEPHAFVLARPLPASGEEEVVADLLPEETPAA